MPRSNVSPRVLERVRGLAGTPLYRSASALVLTTGANAASGLIYWTLAARLYPTEAVGLGAASVAAMLLASMLGCTGITPALIRFLPTSGIGALRLVQAAYLASALMALCAGVGLLLSTQFGIKPLAIHSLAYLAGVLVWVVFTLEDGALIGLKRVGWVPIENAVFGVTKIALLIALSGTNAAWAIYASWPLAAILMVVPVNLVLFGKFLPQRLASRDGPSDGPEFADVARFAAGNHASGLLMALPDFLMPIIVLQIEGAVNNAYFYAAWALVWPLRLIGVNIANALTAEAATDERKLVQLWRWAGLLAAAVYLPLVLILALGSHTILTVLYGTEYADKGEVLMRVLAFGLPLYAFASLYVAAARVRRDITGLLILAVGAVAVGLFLNISLILGFGINGAGMAWLGSQVFLAIAALVIWLIRGADVRAAPSRRLEDIV